MDETILDQFKEWIRSESKLPQNMDEILLQRYLKVYDNKDLKKSQDLLKLNLKLRKSGSNLFTNRDILSDETQAASRTMQYIPLPKLTADGFKVSIMRMANPDPNEFDYVQMAKMALMMFDARFTTYDADSKIADGECFISDLTGMSFRHMFQMARNMGTAALYSRFTQEAEPFVIKKIHIIYAPSIFDKFFTLMRPLMSKKVIESMHLHTQGYESLYEFVSKDCLPGEYGGHLGPLDDLHRSFMEFVESKRSYLMDDSNWELKN